MASNMPTTKVLAGALAGALTVIATWALHQGAKVDMPIEVQGAVQLVITFVVQYLVPDTSTQPEQESPK